MTKSLSRDGNAEASTSRAALIPQSLHSMAAGAGAGLVSSIVTCPLDVVKTSLQAQHLARDSKEYEGVKLTTARIWKQAGFKGFYRGLGPTVAGYLPTWGIYFSVYDLVKDRLGEYAANKAGATATTLTNPLWVVKTRFMVSWLVTTQTNEQTQAVLPPSAAKYSNTVDAVRTIYRTEGLGAFYKGLMPSLMGVSHVAVQFPLYEKAKSWAAFSKMVASLATYPHEVLRTRLQIRLSTPASSGSKTFSTTPLIPPSASSPTSTKSNQSTSSTPLSGAPGSATLPQSRWTPRTGGVVDTFLKIKKQDGWRGFYRGLSINLVRTVPNSAVTMLTYELIMRKLQ
ncbi:hypothetical protein P7C73_g4631, partial [Tremellales sp. Uapishka_1]